MDSTEREHAGSQARQHAARLTAKDIHGVALTWVDNAGVTRVKAVPTARLPQAAQWGVGMSPVFDVYLSDDSAVTSPHIGGPVGDLRLVPDLDRLTCLAAQPGWAWAPVDRYEQDGTPYAACQRQFARRMTARAAETGLEFRMGFETEWTVTAHPTEQRGPHVPHAAEGPAYGMTRVVGLSDYVRDLFEALAVQDVDVLQIHPEYTAGQFEVSVAPADPVRAADLVVLVRETVRAVSHRHGLSASFAPVVTAGPVGNGAHLHLSLWRDGKNLCRAGDGPHGMTRTCESFLAGALEELPALLAVGAPLPASYLRLRPNLWAGAYQCWGVENREAALRFIPGPPLGPDAANAELKCFDAAANPYLLVGAVIAAGLHGIDRELTLPEPVPGNPADTGTTPRLPSSLPAALDHFARSELLRAELGGALFEALLAVRRGEAELARGRSPRELAEALRNRY
ncbi:glutamine synthetase family protein [Streptomyces sp. UNOC14_S4]|uniref:glutamine synthetase family protein n=1 Tax=Streptomyces sp. UNOC14_S4 TaxID=2872340 RepID=UPI001E4AD6F0|nr:glutamine synthetase family protein [Streptomyces sp. UNOC14_S4]MCC3768894.1 glutamine synthetase family protein [Streptomyces sp. UNOC14_S4]